MGSAISKEKLAGKFWLKDGIPELNVPINFYEVGDNLYGCGLIGENSHFKKLESMGVKLLVVVTTETLSQGKITNYPTSNKNYRKKSEYYNPPENYLEDVKLEILHLPTDDVHPPGRESVNIFLKRSKETIIKGGKICVMCWTGSGRAATFLALHLIHNEEYTYDEAFSALGKSCTPKTALKSKYQRKFLEKFAKLGKDNPDVYHIPKCESCDQKGLWICELCEVSICHDHKSWSPDEGSSICKKCVECKSPATCRFCRGCHTSEECYISEPEN